MKKVIDVRGPANGWHAIDVFSGHATKYFEGLIDQAVPLTTVNGGDTVGWYAQAKQDKIVLGMFRYAKNLYHVDLAANDNHEISNTYALDRFYNWRGLCIEANPIYWLDLSRSRTCDVVGSVVGGETRGEFEDVVKFHMDDYMGGIIRDDFHNKDQNAARTRDFYTVPLLEVLERFDAPLVIDFLSLDVEGAESFVMIKFPFEKYEFKVICVEAAKSDLQEAFKANNYIFLKSVNVDTWWVHKDYQSELDLKCD